MTLATVVHRKDAIYVIAAIADTKHAATPGRPNDIDDRCLTILFRSRRNAPRVKKVKAERHATIDHTSISAMRTNSPAVLKFAFPSDGTGEVSAVLVL